VTVVNGGMPITFVGKLNPVAPEKIQATIASMLAAGVQAVRAASSPDREGGLQPLNAHDCEWIERGFGDIEKAAGWRVS
jgi:hypothetical protein